MDKKHPQIKMSKKDRKKMIDTYNEIFSDPKLRQEHLEMAEAFLSMSPLSQTNY